MRVDLNTGTEVQYPDGWETGLSYRDQSNEAKAAAVNKVSENFLMGTLVNESGAGNTRIKSSTFTEGIVDFLCEPQYLTPVEHKGFLLIAYIKITITLNTI
jgi:hypothetical protein